MFLQILDDAHKIPFLNLAYTLMGADGEYAWEEKVQLASCEKEMNVASYEGKKVPVEEEAAKFLDLDTAGRAKIYFELLEMVLADDDLADEESEIMEKIRTLWNIPKTVEEKMEKIIYNINGAYGRLFILLNEV